MFCCHTAFILKHLKLQCVLTSKTILFLIILRFFFRTCLFQLKSYSVKRLLQNTTADTNLRFLVMAYIFKLNMHFSNRPATHLVSRYGCTIFIQSSHQQSECSINKYKNHISNRKIFNQFIMNQSNCLINQ